MSPVVDDGNDVYLGCESCGLVSIDVTGDDPTLVQRCSRCGHVLHATKPFSLQRTWACIVAAAVLYVPANTLPVMETTSALQHDEHTLLGGIHELWLDGSWALALIVFIASIAVPVLKIGVLILFIAIAATGFSSANFQPFAPQGFAGISAAAGTIFFTYVGLDAVSTAGEEVENPKRNLPQH